MAPLLATFTNPFNSTIYNHPFFAKHASTTKIPHLFREKTYLNSWMECMILFIEIMCDRNGRKTPKDKTIRLKTKEKFPVWLLSHPHFYDMEANCFPVSENTENELDLTYVGGIPNLMGQKKKTGSDAVRTGSMNLYKRDSKIFRKSRLELGLRYKKNSSRTFNNPLVTVPKAPITIGTIVTFMFHSYFNSLARSRYLSFFSHSFSFILWSAGTA